MRSFWGVSIKILERLKTPSLGHVLQCELIKLLALHICNARHLSTAYTYARSQAPFALFPSCPPVSTVIVIVVDDVVQFVYSFLLPFLLLREALVCSESNSSAASNSCHLSDPYNCPVPGNCWCAVYALLTMTMVVVVLVVVMTITRFYCDEVFQLTTTLIYVCVYVLIIGCVLYTYTCVPAIFMYLPVFILSFDVLYSSDTAFHMNIPGRCWGFHYFSYNIFQRHWLFYL